MATTTTPKPTSSPKGKTLDRWTDEQVTMLTDAVKASPTAKAAFESVAAKLGKSPGTVQQKYYALQRKANTKPRRVGNPKAAARSAARHFTKSTPAKPKPAIENIEQLDNTELLALASAIKAEVDYRQAELAKAMAVFG